MGQIKTTIAMGGMEFENLRIMLKNSVLRDLPPEELDELARTVQTRVAGPDEVIFKEGDAPDAFYIISSGQVRIFVRHDDRIERALGVRTWRTLRRGGSFDRRDSYRKRKKC